MIPALFQVLSLMAMADPCLAVPAAPGRDPAAADVYRKVGDGERAAGALETATIAYQAAVARDPADADSREALRQLCSERSRQEDPFGEGLRLMDSGDCRGAVVAFRKARIGVGDGSAALMEGICLFELGNDAEAEPLLGDATRVPAHREAARFYLGLIALRRGEASEAISHLDSAAGAPAFSAPAGDLIRLARKSGRLVVSLNVESGWDSNVSLVPIGESASSSMSDGRARVSGSVLYRPRGESGPYLRAFGLYHRQFQLDTYELSGLSGAAGWQLGGSNRNLIAEYNFDYRTLGGVSYTTAHRLLASGWLSLGTIGLNVTCFSRFESFIPPEYAGFSGTVLGAVGRVLWNLDPAVRVGVGYHLSRELADLGYYSWLEHGPRLEGSWRVTPDLRFGFWLAGWLRQYDRQDPLYGATRSDGALEGSLSVEYDLGAHWSIWLSLEALRTFSNLPVFEYAKVVPNVGITYVLGI